MSDEFNEFSSTLWIRKPFNKMEGIFKLYQSGNAEFDGTMFVMISEEDSIQSSINVRTPERYEVNANLDVKYRENADLKGHLLVAGTSNLNATLEIRPNNRMFGAFEILPPPRVEKFISSTADSTTRSKESLMTVNYGDSQRMMVGRSISSDGDEHLDSFIKFGDIISQMQELSILERSQLRLYYTGDFISGTNLELYLPSDKWSEYGVTHANKPSATELVSNTYTINTVEKYVEFDVKEMTLKWLRDDSSNLGLIIKSNNNHATSFYTREGRFQPSLNVKYITDKVVSLGRAEMVAKMFVWGVGNADLRSTLEVHSDYGLEYLESTLYVHRREVPLFDNLQSKLIATKPDQHAIVTIAKREYSFIDGFLKVQTSDIKDHQTTVTVNKPDLISRLTVDPNISLKSRLTVRGSYEESLTAYMGVTREEVIGKLTVRVKDHSHLSGTLIVQKYSLDDVASTLAVTRPEINSRLIVKAIGENNLEGKIEIPNYEHLESMLAISREEIFGFLDVHTVDEQVVTLYVKDKEYLDATLVVNLVSDLKVTLDVKNKVEVDSTIIITKPDLGGFLYPRVADDHDLLAITKIRQRDVNDLNSYLHVGGAYGAYYFII